MGALGALRDVSEAAMTTKPQPTSV
jgi:hypothetical protein